MRTSIWKALKTRGKAIRTALKRYNSLASQMDLPAPILEWKDVLNYTFVSEFDLLRHSHGTSDVHKKPWTIPFNREVAAKYWKVRGAYDELKRLHVEIPRLRTHIRLQQTEYKLAADACRDTNPLLAAEIQAQYSRLKRVNAIHLRRLHALTRLRGFVGSISISAPVDKTLAQLLTVAESSTACDTPFVPLANGDCSTTTQQVIPPTGEGEDGSDDDNSVVDDDGDMDLMVRYTDFLEDMQASS